jgi:hypothetical protein
VSLATGQPPEMKALKHVDGADATPFSTVFNELKLLTTLALRFSARENLVGVKLSAQPWSLLSW